MSEHWRNVWVASVIVVSVVGCQTNVDPGPSYTELVVTYNAELEALDRLEEEREKLIKEYAAAKEPDAPVDAVTQLEGLLDSANELTDAANQETNSNPESQLDDLIQRNGEAQKIAGQLLHGLLNREGAASKPEPTPEEAAAIAARKAAFESELAELDAEIKKQKERVERARKARDEAESKSQGSSS